MTADPKRPTGPPPSAGVLARYAQAYARELGVAEGRVRAWVAYMILAGVFERATGADAPRFIVKGGVALELRLRDRARATKDIDIVLRDTKADLAGTLEQALTGEAYQGFAGRAHAAYGGIYIAASLRWLWAVEGQRPHAADLVGAGIGIIGSLVIVGFAARTP